MAYYGLSYRVQFDNYEGDLVSAYIRDTTTANGSTDPHQIIDLIGAGDPVVIGTVDNDESKFTPILGQRCTISFLSTNQYTLNTFIQDATDGRYFVEVLLAGAVVFAGFLSLQDSDEDFADPQNYNVVSLQAYDQLGLLKDLPLLKPDGTNPQGKYKIIEYVSWCLKRTGLNLPITVVNNLMEEHFIGLPAWDNIYIDAKTFEDTIGVSLNCYEVLSRILKDQCFLTQLKGAWWVRRIDEYAVNDNYIDLYDTDGVYQSTASGQGLYHKTVIARNGTIDLVDVAPRATVRQRLGKIKEVFNYEYPKEIVDNIDFARGDIYFPLSMPAGSEYYHIDDWALSSAPGSTSAVAYIRRDFQDGYEKARYAVIGADTTTNNDTQNTLYLSSNPIEIAAKDKMGFSCEFRLDRNYSGGRENFIRVAQIRVIGDDGSKWAYDGNTNGWLSVSGFYGINNADVALTYTDSDDQNDWSSVSIESKPIPVAGKLYVVLLHAYKTYECQKHFQNVRFNYIPFINNSYQAYSGQYHKIEEDGFKQKREEETYISDAPKQLFKGAMFRKVGSTYPLAGNWYDGSGPAIRNSPAPTDLHPIGFLQLYELYNQFNRPFRAIEASLKGFNGELPTPVFAYYLNYNNPHSTNKVFRLLHYELHLQTCAWTGYFAEHYDLNIYHSYPTTNWEFKYTEQR